MPLDSNGLFVLVVEDDDELRERILVPGLLRQGFDAVGVNSALGLYRALSLRSCGLFVVDIGLPDESGFEVVRHLRKLGDVGVVMLTGRSDPGDQIRGLEEGADAYLAKPMDVAVLAATLRSVARRLVPEVAPVAAAPAAVIQTESWQLTQQGWLLVSPSGESIKLSANERLLLTVVMGAAGVTVEKERILQQLCGAEHDFDPHRLEMLVHRLRRKVQTVTGDELPLLTVRGTGYLFLA